MKVLLIGNKTPPFINEYACIPIGLLYLSSSLKKHNIETKILDYNIQSHDIEKVMHYFQPDLVGISCSSSILFSETINNAKKIKECSNTPVVIGGLHATMHYRKIMENCPSIDYIILGEGEHSLVHLCDHISNTDKNVIYTIDGIVYRNHNNISVNDKMKYIDNVSSIPWPDYDGINIKSYYYDDTILWNNPKKLTINTTFPIISSRSCPMQCSFCAMNQIMGKKLRRRKPSEVVDEIEYLYNTYKQSYFSFYDDNINLNKSHVIAICHEIQKRNINIQFDTPNAVYMNGLDDEIIGCLVASGLVRISLAIEHGSDFIRNKVMGKNLSTEKIYEVVKACKKYSDLYIRAFFLMGMPEDTKDTLQETYDMIKKIDIHKPVVTNIMPFPGTRLFDQCIIDGLLINTNVEDLWKHSDIYFKGNTKFFIKPYNMTVEELIYFRNKFDTLISQKVEK